MADTENLTTYGILADVPHGRNRNMAPVAEVTQRFNEFHPIAQEAIRNSDTVAVSWDFDGVLFQEYNDGQPVFHDTQLQILARHAKRFHTAAQEAGKQSFQLVNTNRELPTAIGMMMRLDPEDMQKNWGFALEGGHVIAYRHHFDESQMQRNGDQEFVILPDGTQAQVQATLDDGSRVVTEDLLGADHLKGIRIGAEGLTLRDARQKIVDLFDGMITAGQLGEAFIPPHRMGMVTARSVPKEAIQNGVDIDPKKHFVHAGAPILDHVRRVLGVQTEEELPFDVVYYPMDGGLDIQFKLDKSHGQLKLVQRFKQLGLIPQDNKVAIAHVGDSGSDNIPFVSEDLQLTNIVVATGNADKGLAEKAAVQTPGGFMRGARETMYTITQLLQGKTIDMTQQMKPQETRPQYEEIVAVPGSMADHILSYLGRNEPQAGDIDIQEVLEKVDIIELRRLTKELRKVQERKGRIFLAGNGGSYDNARLIAKYLKSAGIEAQTPGDDTLYMEITEKKGYEHIFAEGLKEKGFGPNDMFIGISGSGNSPNILLAQDVAQRAWVSGHNKAIREIQNAGYSIDTSLSDLPELSGDLSNFEEIVQASKGFEQSLKTAYHQATQDGNYQIAEEITQILGSRTNMALGGRDGGKMKELAGKNIHIAQTPCMEALEDEHPLIMAAIAESLKTGTDVGETISNQIEIIDALRKPETAERLIKMGEAMNNAILSRKRIVIIGDPAQDPSVPHGAADWARGYINGLPIPGSEISVASWNINATMATGNDDGILYTDIDQFSKMVLGPEDIVVMIGGSTKAESFELCLDYAEEECQAQVFIIGTQVGARQADIPTSDPDVNLAATAIVHTMSRAGNDYIKDPRGMNWQVEHIDTKKWPAHVQVEMKERMRYKKMDKKNILAFEMSLRNQGLLPDGKVITFCYGNLYLADDPSLRGLQRGFY